MGDADSRPRAASAGIRGGESDALKPGWVDEIARLETFRGHSRTHCWGVSKVLGLRLPERSGRFWAEERKCGCLEGGMGGGLEEGGPALERT